eukprot:TRINITY_DN28349_c0_g1_i1.p2 TRINITY_DN28349_c0_g1~~TRINITY_DN28349_c0_g1_i1.p2  ORF type:complete len:187 (+),score=55.60 TRINITY_DN28349_c0_g1_i1:100-660(+)
MDSYTQKKRSQDPTLALALHSNGAMKMRSAQANHVDILKKQKELAQGMRQRIGEDIAAQAMNVKGCHSAIKKSRNCGQMTYVKVTPPSEQGREGHAQTMQQFQKLLHDGSAAQAEASNAEKAERKVQGDFSNVGVDTFSAWFSRYGDPKRQAGGAEKARSCVLKPRWKPGVGWSQAQAMKKGTLID